MIRRILMALILGFFAFSVQAADPEGDRKAFESYFSKKFPKTPIADYINGVYAVDPAAREQWMAIEEFPPYEINLDEGKTLWETPFANGKTYQSCFKWPLAEGIRHHYPFWDKDKQRVTTVELALNECREANGEKPLKYKKGKMTSLSSWVGYHSRGKKTNVVIPDDKAAMAAYEEGKHFYYAKRGQLNMSCADCHVYNSGNWVRADHLSPALGHTTGFPVFRSKWGGMGTLHRRFGGCNKNIRAKPFKAQGRQYRNLEYFLTYMSNGLEINAPSSRK